MPVQNCILTSFSLTLFGLRILFREKNNVKMANNSKTSISAFCFHFKEFKKCLHNFTDWNWKSLFAEVLMPCSAWICKKTKSHTFRLSTTKGLSNFDCPSWHSLICLNHSFESNIHPLLLIFFFWYPSAGLLKEMAKKSQPRNCRCAVGGKTGKTSVLPGFSKIEHGGAPHYGGLT